MNVLQQYFVIPVIDKPEYIDRLNTEIDLLEQMNFIWFIKRFIEIFNKHIKNDLYLLRGSAGSSLLLYYLGVNQFDPVQYNIPISRFINKLRLSKPDIDIDLPMTMRDNIINEIINLNNDAIRMSCNLHNENNENFESLVKEFPTVNLIHNSGVIIYTDDQQELINSNKITPTQVKFTKDDIDKLNLKKIDLLANGALEQLVNIKKNLEAVQNIELRKSLCLQKIIKNNINIDDINVSNFTFWKQNEELVKSSCLQKIIKNNIDFDDINVYNFISNEDDGCGITYAETPLIQHVIKILKPQNLTQLSTCLTIVRPMACHNIKKNMTFQSIESKIIYDDDFISYLSKKLNLTEDKSDYIRRLFKKNTNTEEMNDFINYVDNYNLTDIEKSTIKKMLFKAKSYGFCKSHALNYSRLVYMLYYCKFYFPKYFWKQTIKTIKGYYNDWVYIRNGISNGLKFKGIKKCDQFRHFLYTGFWIGKDFMSRCYLKILDNPSKQQNIEISCDDCNITYKNDIEKNDIDNYYLENNQQHQIEKNNNTDEVEKQQICLNKLCEFRGLVAGTTSTYTIYKKYQTIITIGYANGKFINLFLNKKKDFSKFKQVIGKGYYIDGVCPHIIITHMQIF